MVTSVSVDPKAIEGVGRVAIVCSDHRKGRIEVFCQCSAEKNGDSVRTAHSKLYRNNELIFTTEDVNFGNADIVYTDVVAVGPKTTYTYVWDAGTRGPVRNEKFLMVSQFMPDTSEAPQDADVALDPITKTSKTPVVEAEISADSRAGTFKLRAIGRAHKNTADGIEAGLTVTVNEIRMFNTGDHAFDKANLVIDESFPAMPCAKFRVKAELSFSYAVVMDEVELTLSFNPQT